MPHFIPRKIIALIIELSIGLGVACGGDAPCTG
jgi:hypothetical protein